MKKSSAAKLVELVWQHNREATGWSWTRLNQSMSAAVSLAISAGMHFNEGDFADFCNAYSGGRWMGNSQGENGFAEHFYSHAIATGNLSACKSFEAFKKREPFIFEGQRLGLNSVIEGFKVRTLRGEATVNSFSKCGTYLNATASGWKDVPECKVWGALQRIKYTLEELRAHNAELARAKKAKKKHEKQNKQGIEAAPGDVR